MTIRVCEHCGQRIGIGNLRQARVDAGLTVAEAARTLGVPKATYYRWEYLDYIPPLKHEPVMQIVKRWKRRR